MVTMPTHKRNRFFSFLGSSSSSDEPEFHESQDKFYYEQIASIAGAGGWYIDFEERKTYFDKQLRAILETPDNYSPSLKHTLHFYDMEFHDVVQTDFDNLKKGIPFEHILKMVTYTNTVFWARAMGIPVKDSRGKVVGLKGVIVNIDEEKKRELKLQQAIEIIQANNSRLFKFANYVSHNLKSHVNNLELTSQLVDEDNLKDEQRELFNNYREIAKSLSRTVAQLNEVVSIQNKAAQEKVVLNLEQALERSKQTLQHLIDREEAYIYSDFSEVPEVNYIPQFLDNILCTLIKNGIVNKKMGRKPEIKAYSLEDNGNTSLIIEDNGTGIDMEKEGDRIFHMSKSSDSSTDNQSVGLFIVKNQIEALGGKISVVSKLGYGTKFIIKF